MTSEKEKKSSTAKTALVTGASRGIGLEFARILAKNGYDLILVARSEDKLRALAETIEKANKVRVTVITEDLTKPDAASKVHNQTIKLGLQVEVLINNAGIGQYGAYLDLDPEEERRMLQLNIITLTEMTRLYAKHMAERHKGRILNVASIAAFQPGPLMACYYASKAYVLSFSEALANELSPFGVTVTALCPGATRSGFQDAAHMQSSRIMSFSMMSAQEVAHYGYDALKKGKVVAVPGLSNWLLTQSIRFSPRSLVTKVSRFIAAPSAS